MSLNFWFDHFIRQAGKFIKLIPLLSIYAYSANGQTVATEYKDVARQRLLIRITAQYVHTVSQGQIDMDSAIRIPCHIYGFSPTLAYNEGYSDGKTKQAEELRTPADVAKAISRFATLQGQARLRLSMELGAYLLFKSGEEKRDLSEAGKYIQTSQELSKTAPVVWKIEALILKANWLQRCGRAQQCEKVYNEALALAEQAKDQTAIARALMALGESFPYGHPDRLKNFKRALAIYRSLHAKEKVIEALSQVNICYFVNKQYDIAEAHIREIIQLQTAIGFRQQQYPYDALCWLSMRKGDLITALSYSDKSLGMVKSKGDSVFLSTFYTRRGVILGYLFKNDEALSWFDKGLENRSIENRLFWYRTLIAKVSLLNSLGKPQKALAAFEEIEQEFPPTSVFEKMHLAYLLGLTYAKLEKPFLAENNFNVFLTIAEGFPKEYIYDEFPAAFLNISAFYRVRGSPQKAKQLLERSRALISKFDLASQSSYYYNLYKLDSIERRYLSALKHLRQSKLFSDSAFSHDQQKNAAELLMKYETERNGNNIRLLDSQGQLKKNLAREAVRKKYITLIGAALSLIIFTLLYYIYRLKLDGKHQVQAHQRELDQKNAHLARSDQEQEKLIREKEWLIKEVHHRVKNNLQMVTGLLYSQSVYLEDNMAKQAIKDSLRRIQAMSLIHQKLYDDENTALLPMPGYINDLVKYLHESFDADDHIIFEQKVAPVELDVSQAIPLGLIVTEGIVNAIKYAFLSGQKGIVKITLGVYGEKGLVLKISDNGIGLPATLDKMEGHSLGLDLMQGLTRQLNGTFDIENKSGVHITIKFNISPGASYDGPAL